VRFSVSSSDSLLVQRPELTTAKNALLSLLLQPLVRESYLLRNTSVYMA
jgi:hypothetical protein